MRFCSVVGGSGYRDQVDWLWVEREDRNNERYHSADVINSGVAKSWGMIVLHFFCYS